MITRTIEFDPVNRKDSWMYVPGQEQYLAGFEAYIRENYHSGRDDLVVLQAVGLKGKVVKACLELSVTQAERLVTSLQEMLDEYKNNQTNADQA